jgi:hypothetical protein
MKPILYEAEHIKPELLAEDSETAYQLVIYQWKSTGFFSPSFAGPGCMNNGEVPVNPALHLLRTYLGLNSPTLCQIYDEIGQKANYEIQLGETTAEQVIQSVDDRLARKDSLEKGIEMHVVKDSKVVKDPKFLFGQAWKSVKE